MKKVLSAITAILFALSLCACGETANTPSDDPAFTFSQAENFTTERSEAATDYETSETTWTSTDATTQDTTPVHTHSYSNATCTKPAACSCGATQGEANGHNYSGGTCTICGETDSHQEQASNVWIPTNGGQKYHKTASCSGMKNPEQVTKSEAESRGFTPCKKCYS